MINFDIEKLKFDEKGLIPAIVVDAVSKKVLTLAYMNKESLEISLEKDGEYPILDGKNVLIIEDGAAFMKSADCPDKLCVHQGKIKLSGERITCLPNKVMIEIVAEGDDVLVS